MLQKGDSCFITENVLHRVGSDQEFTYEIGVLAHVEVVLIDIEDYNIVVVRDRGGTLWRLPLEKVRKIAPDMGDLREHDYYWATIAGRQKPEPVTVMKGARIIFRAFDGTNHQATHVTLHTRILPGA